MLVFKLIQRTFAARFGSGDSRLRDIGNDLCVDYWERGLRSRSIAYFERAAPKEPSLEYSSQLILMRLADGQWQAAETLVRSILENTNPERADAKTLRIVAQTAMVFPTRDVALSARITDFAERLFHAEPQAEGIDLLMALAQLRSGRIESAFTGYGDTAFSYCWLVETWKLGENEAPFVENHLPVDFCKVTRYPR